MKKLFATYVGAAALALSLGFFAGCTGTNGTNGADGADGAKGDSGVAGINGANGVDANQTCTQCHANDQIIVAKQTQWDLSGHKSGASFAEEGNNKSCAPCHNGWFASAVMSGTAMTPADSALMLGNYTVVNCRTCHKIHEAYDTTDWGLIKTDSVTMLIGLAKVNLGEGALCASCHQARRTYVGTVAATDSITSSSWGPHHGPQTNVLLGRDGWLQTDAPGAHAGITNACVTCHLGPNKTHTFAPELAACQNAACHGASATSFDIGGVQTTVDSMLNQVMDSLVSKGIAVYDTTISENLEAGTMDTVIRAAIIRGVRIPRKLSGSYWNYITSWEDRSHGVHNPNYVIGMLQTAIDSLK